MAIVWPAPVAGHVAEHDAVDPVVRPDLRRASSLLAYGHTCRRPSELARGAAVAPERVEEHVDAVTVDGCTVICLERTTRVSRSSRRGRSERLSGRRLAQGPRARRHGDSPSKYEPDERPWIRLGSVFPLRFVEDRLSAPNPAGPRDGVASRPARMFVPSARGGSAPERLAVCLMEPGERLLTEDHVCTSRQVSTRPGRETHRCDSAGARIRRPRSRLPVPRSGPPAGARRRAPANVLSRGPDGDTPSCSPREDDPIYSTITPFEEHDPSQNVVCEECTKISVCP